MMFSLKSFIKSGLLDAVGKMADYQVILNAAGWLDKGVLDETDLAEIQAAIEASDAPQEVETVTTDGTTAEDASAESEATK